MNTSQVRHGRLAVIGYLARVSEDGLEIWAESREIRARWANSVQQRMWTEHLGPGGTVYAEVDSEDVVQVIDKVTKGGLVVDVVAA